MPSNPGFNPFRNTEGVRIDLRLRNGRIVRGVDPKGWRWKPWPWGEDEFDVVHWQECVK